MSSPLREVCKLEYDWLGIFLGYGIVIVQSSCCDGAREKYISEDKFDVAGPLLLEPCSV